MLYDKRGVTDSLLTIVATWVKRYPSDEDTLIGDKSILSLTDVQKDKLSHFFSHVFDMDRDDIISVQDFESFTEVNCVEIKGF